jgi:hypothetical protein
MQEQFTILLIAQARIHKKEKFQHGMGTTKGWKFEATHQINMSGVCWDWECKIVLFPYLAIPLEETEPTHQGDTVRK